MKNAKILPIIISSLLLSDAYATENAKAIALTAEQKKEVENIVKDLLKNEPELIESALRAGMEKKEAAAMAEATKVVKKEHAALFEDSNDPFLGNPKGSISMVIFMDPYCGYCRKFQANILAALKERKDLKVIYKALPILSVESKKAAEEELAAHKIGRFQDYHEAIYESAVRTRKERFEVAEKNNIDTAKIMENLPGVSSSKGATQIEKQLEANKKLAKKLNINGTPAFIIGDTLNGGAVDKETLIKMIDDVSKK